MGHKPVIPGLNSTALEKTQTHTETHANIDSCFQHRVAAGAFFNIEKVLDEKLSCVAHT
jgi:hypothetical protein